MDSDVHRGNKSMTIFQESPKHPPSFPYFKVIRDKPYGHVDFPAISLSINTSCEKVIPCACSIEE